VFLWQHSLSPRGFQQAEVAFGMIPARIFGIGTLPQSLLIVPAWATLFTSMFMHGGWWHLIGNMWFLRIFGDNIEDSMGTPRFAIFYVCAGVAAALAQAAIGPSSQIPMVGASGAIAGVMGAYLMLYPRANVRVLAVFFLFIRIVNVPAVIVLSVWIGLQVLGAATAPADVGGVAVWAHIGGFLAGILLLVLFKRSDVPLFGAPQTQAFAVLPARVTRVGRIPTVTPRDPRRPWG